MDILNIIEKILGFSFLGLGGYFFFYALKTQKWKNYDFAITVRRFSVAFLSILLGTLILLGYADIL